jgi:hypothetical protein
VARRARRPRGRGARRAITVALAGVGDEQALGTDAEPISDGIRFCSTGFTLLTDQGWLAIAPEQWVMLIADAARMDGDTVTLPGGTELLLYARIRPPRRSPDRYPWIAYLADLHSNERGVLLADRGVRFFSAGLPRGRLSLLRLGLVLVAATHAGLRAAAGSLPYLIIVALGTLALARDAQRSFETTWRAVHRPDPRAWPAALERARNARRR